MNHNITETRIKKKFMVAVKLCLISYSVCPRNRILLGIYMAVCYLLVRLVRELDVVA